MAIHIFSQDADTAEAIGSKSYNTIVAELVAFETEKPEGERSQNKQDEDFVDFAAATAATLGVPSPSISRARSFDDTLVPAPSDGRERKGDLEEAEELMRVLNLSRTELSGNTDLHRPPDTALNFFSTNYAGNQHTKCSEYEIENVLLMAQDGDGPKDSLLPEVILTQECTASIDCKSNSLSPNIISTDSDAISSMVSVQSSRCALISEGFGDNSDPNNLSGNVRTDISIHKEAPPADECFANKDQTPVKSRCTSQESTEDISIPQTHSNTVDNLIDSGMTVPSIASAPNTDSCVSIGREESVDASECVSSLEDSEPIYEGEECILDSQHSTFEDREPVYEGEIILAEQSGKIDVTSSQHSLGEGVGKQCELSYSCSL